MFANENHALNTGNALSASKFNFHKMQPFWQIFNLLCVHIIPILIRNRHTDNKRKYNAVLDALKS